MADFQNDQAAGLRRIMATPKPRVMSIIAASYTQDQPRMMTNLAASIRSQGSEVLIVHASKASREASYEINDQPALFDVANETATLADAINGASHGVSVAKLLHQSQVDIPLDADAGVELSRIFDALAGEYEIVLVDATLNDEYVLPLKTLNESEI